MILNDTDTAYPIAFMDATGIMALRTGAAAAIMGKYCAKHSSKVMTVVGAGVQKHQRAAYVYDYNARS